VIMCTAADAYKIFMPKSALFLKKTDKNWIGASSRLHRIKTYE